MTTNTPLTNSMAAASGDFLLGGDLRVNRLGFGAMRLPSGTFWGPPRDPATGRAVLRRAVELGVNHIDTAAFYGTEGLHANDLIRETLAPYAADLVIATKVGPLRDSSGRISGQAGPDGLRALVEENLQPSASSGSTWSTCGSAGWARRRTSRWPSGSRRWRPCARRA